MKPDTQPLTQQPEADHRPEVIVVAGGNLNGLVLRLVAERLNLQGKVRVSLLHNIGLTDWPEFPGHQFNVVAEHAKTDEILGRVATADALVLPASFRPEFGPLIRTARNAGIPAICIVADSGFGTERFKDFAREDFPTALCIPDPLTMDLCINSGFPREVLVNAGKQLVCIGSGNIKSNDTLNTKC